MCVCVCMLMCEKTCSEMNECVTSGGGISFGLSHTDGRAVLLLHAHAHTHVHTLRGHFTLPIHTNIYKGINCLVVKLPVVSMIKKTKQNEVISAKNKEHFLCKL